MKIIRSIVALALGALVLGGCGENAVQDITGPVAGSRVKFFNFGVNAPSVNFYANDQKITAITSATGTESVLGVAYGGVGSGGFYSALAPGQYAFKAKIAAATDKDVTISSVSSTIADGKAYSFFTSGFYDATTKTVDGFVVQDDYPAETDFTMATVRFVNAISNSQPLSLNAFFGLNPFPLGGPVAYKSGGTFVKLLGGVYDLSAFGTNIAVSRTAVNFVQGRTYTVTARGDITVTGTTAATRAQLDVTLNR